MKMFAAVLLFASAASAARIPRDYQAQASTVRTATFVQPEPIAIVRSVYNHPTEEKHGFDYAFETANGIKTEATGEMKSYGDSTFLVMRGSYQYVGADGEDYQVNWYADETGYHADAVHLPKNVPIPYPSIQEAVDAQLRFAAEEDAAAARTGNTYAASVPQPTVVRSPQYSAPAVTRTAAYSAPVVAVASEPAVVEVARSPAPANVYTFNPATGAYYIY